MAKVPFTRSRIESLPLPKRGYTVYHDTEVPGLVVLVYATGTKTFSVYKKCRGRNTSIKKRLGKFGEINVETARKLARKALTQLIKDNFVVKKPASVLPAAEPTIRRVFERYIEVYARIHCRTWKSMLQNFNRYYADIAAMELSSITKLRAQEHFNTIAREHGKATANRALDDMKAAVNWAIRYDLYVGTNPFTNLVRFKLRERERFILPDEFKNLFDALMSEKNTAFRDYVYLSLFTGARQSNVLSMRWSEIDMDLALWRIPLTKNQESQTVPLTAAALEVLRSRERTDSDWVFPSDSASGHYVEPKNAWRKLLKSAGISDLRLHDLRRTLGSYMAINNFSLPLIGSVLGHKSERSTRIYARLSTAPLLNAMEVAQASMLRLAKGVQADPQEGTHLGVIAD